MVFLLNLFCRRNVSWDLEFWLSQAHQCHVLCACSFCEKIVSLATKLFRCHDLTRQHWIISDSFISSTHKGCTQLVKCGRWALHRTVPPLFSPRHLGWHTSDLRDIRGYTSCLQIHLWGEQNHMRQCYKMSSVIKPTLLLLCLVNILSELWMRECPGDRIQSLEDPHRIRL